MRAALAVVVVALSLGGASPAAAESAAQGADRTALERLDRGIDAYRAGDWVGARREFEAARRLVPDKANAYRWLGLTEVQLGDCTQALLDFQMFLKLVPANDERVPEVIRLRNECERTPSGQRPQIDLTPRADPPTTLATAPPSSLSHTRLVRRWWFWTALAGGAALVATGVTLGVVYGTTHETRLMPIVCAPAGCTPGPL
jgi:tetratricopeptide (TPR) repeat protein